jgi:hypothetical protein
MRAATWFGPAGLAAVALVLGGCTSPMQPPADGPPAATAAPATTATAEAKEQEIPVEPVESGKACAKAEAQCGGGVCALTLDNACAEPITCNLAILTVCQGPTDLMQVKGKTRDTVAAQKKSKLSLSANCNEGRVVSTKVESLDCK